MLCAESIGRVKECGLIARCSCQAPAFPYHFLLHFIGIIVQYRFLILLVLLCLAVIAFIYFFVLKKRLYGVRIFGGAAKFESGKATEKMRQVECKIMGEAATA